MRQVVVAEDPFLSPAGADAIDHRSVVQRIGEDDAAGQQLGQRPQRRFIGNIARGEQQGCLLAMPEGEFPLQLDMGMAGARDVARAACARTAALEDILHGRQHAGMLAHAEIVIGAPDSDLLSSAALGGGAMAQRQGEAPGQALQVGKDAIAPFGFQPGDRIAEMLFVIHGHDPGQMAE